MPYEWVDPEVFVEHAGVTVYHIYKNDFAGQGTRTYHFGTGIGCSDENPGENGEFDIRNLPGAAGLDLDDVEVARAFLMAAIDDGHLTPFEEDDDDGGKAD
jgi:hypothetical protein